MSEADRALLQRAAAAHRPLARAAKLARGNGLGYAIFGGLSVAFALSGMDVIGLAVGTILLAVGIHEHRQSSLLARAEISAPQRLAYGELVLLGTIVIYAVLGLTVMPSAGDTLTKQLGNPGSLGIDLRRLADSINSTWYITVIALALLYQGGMARYFLNRRADVATYLATAPFWARGIVETMAS